jgi:hypothetical protein
VVIQVRTHTKKELREYLEDNGIGLPRLPTHARDPKMWW